MATLDGKVALVSGASTGIGRATALALARHGATVALVARSSDLLQEVAEEVTSGGGTARALPHDLTEPEAASAVVTEVVAQHGGVDVLVHSAGTADWENTGLLGADLDQWVRELEVNLLATMRLTHAAAPHLRDGGHVVTVSSGADDHVSAAYPAYVVSKWGVRAFSGSMVGALRERGVRLTMVSPGEVDTPMQPDGAADQLRMLDPEDVADAVVWAVTRPRHVNVEAIRINPSVLPGSQA